MVLGLSKIFGSANDRIIKSYEKTVDKINALEPDLEKLTDAEIRTRFEAMRKQAEEGTDLNILLPETFALVREAGKRTLGLRMYDVQMIGGIVIHEGKIAEMATGEGKTLTCTLSVALNALAGKGVHVITVNDYLAARDAKWMATVYDFLGLTTGAVLENMDDMERKAAYSADVTYGTNNQFGFDYLRDNLKPDADMMVQRTFNFAIVDEVDSILIDESRTPLIISGPADDSGHYYTAVNALIPKLEHHDFEMDEKLRSVTLTDAGQEKIETLLFNEGLVTDGGLYDMQNIALVHHVNQALRAHKLFQKDQDYIIKDNKVIIIDEFTGRMMEGRRYSDGLHQALEAKEGVTIQKENQTLASITFQNYFRMYPKLAGMTGTAMTEEAEFHEIYKLAVVSIPTNKPIARQDHDDEIYRTHEDKVRAVSKLIHACQKKGQPVLVGTTSIEKSEELSKHLKKLGVKHNVLNARKHQKEAEIVAYAGKPGAVTIATNMAGRGTDIQLGGNLDRLIDDLSDEKKAGEEFKKRNAEVKKVGGLYIIGTERHESRRIDNQLRGRAGRQGDPGESKFFLSLDDDLMRIFGSERLDAMLKRIGMPEGQAIHHPWISKALERAQKKVEHMHFEGRKELLKYDDVMNDQRKVIYEQRREIMTSDDLSEMLQDMGDDAIERVVKRHIPPGSYPEQWNTTSLKEEIKRTLGLDLPIIEWAAEEGIAEDEIIERILEALDKHMEAKEKKSGSEVFRRVEKQVFLISLDQIWKEHLYTLDHLRQGIRLRAFGQRDPLNEFKAEAFSLFQEMLENLGDQVTQTMAMIQVQSDNDVEEVIPYERPKGSKMTLTRGEDWLGDGIDAAADGAESQQKSGPLNMLAKDASVTLDPKDPSTWGRVQRNAMCPCGSGLKYKHCHGAPGYEEANAPAGPVADPDSEASKKTKKA